MKKKPGGFALSSRTAAVSMALVAALTIGSVAVGSHFSGKAAPAQGSAKNSVALNAEERAATIQVTEGSGWLSTGEEIQIAEWYSGPDRGEGVYFANFRGSDGGATVDLRLAGLNRSGTFSCGEASASEQAASVELRVDVENSYRSDSKAGAGDCRVTVTRLDDRIMEGYYQATLVNSGDAADALTITGTFRATRPGAERLSAAGSPVVAEL